MSKEKKGLKFAKRVINKTLKVKRTNSEARILPSSNSAYYRTEIEDTSTAPRNFASASSNNVSPENAISNFVNI